MSGDLRRAQIAKAVLQLVGKRGLLALTASTLADEVGVTSGALFRHFRSRDEMLAAAVHYAVDKIEGTFPDATLPGRERVVSLARNRVELLAAEPGLAWLLRSEQAYLALPEGAVTALRALVERSRRFFVTAIEDGAADGTIRRDIDANALALVVMGTVHALVGMPGVHRRPARAAQLNLDQVLLALAQLIAPVKPSPRKGENR